MMRVRALRCLPNQLTRLRSVSVNRERAVAGRIEYAIVLNIPGSQSNIMARALARVHAGRHRKYPTREGRCPPAPFIVGSPRSGTTLLRMMLDSHPQIAIPPETGFLPHTLTNLFGSDERRRHALMARLVNFPRRASGWQDFGLTPQLLLQELSGVTPFRLDEGLRCFYRAYAARFGKTRWGDKTPSYGAHMRVIEHLLPEARFIHIIRDGRDVALSLRTLWFSPGIDMRTLARKWRRDIGAIRNEASHCRWYLELRYESLVRDPQRTLKEVCAFIDIDYDADMTHYHLRAPSRLAEHGARVRNDGLTLVSRAERLAQQRLLLHPPDPTRISRWKTDMPERDRREYESVAGDLLAALGYECG